MICILFSNPQCMFAHSLRRFALRDWSIEQKWMSVLLPLLLLYNGETAGLQYVIIPSIQSIYLSCIHLKSFESQTNN